MPTAVARAPARNAATPKRAARTTSARSRSAARRKARSPGVRSSSRRGRPATRAPPTPTSTENTAEAVATTNAVGTEPGVDGADATAPNAKTRNIGPGGAQRPTSDATLMSTAQTAPRVTTSHARSGTRATSTPSSTEATRRAPTVSCIRSRGTYDALRPYSDVNAPNEAYSDHSSRPIASSTSSGTSTEMPARIATRCAPACGPSTTRPRSQSPGPVRSRPACPLVIRPFGPCRRAAPSLPSGCYGPRRARAPLRGC